MKTRKSFLCLILLLAIPLAPLAGCDSKNAEPSNVPSAEPSDSPNPTDDDAFYYSDGIDKNGFWESVRALDYIEMFNYQAMLIPHDIYQISDDSVQEEVDNILANIVEKEELTDDFVASNLLDEYGWATVDEMMDEVRLSLQKKSIQEYVYQFLSNDVTIRSVPDQMTNYQEQAMLSYYQANARNSGMELDEYLVNNEGISSVDELIEANYDSNIETAKFYLVIQAVAEDAGLTVSDEDIANYLGTSDYSSYEEQYGLPYLKQYCLIQKVIDHIVENAVLEQ